MISQDCAKGEQVTHILFDSHVDTVNLDPLLGPIEIAQGTVDIHGPITIMLPPGTVGVNQFIVDGGTRLELKDVTLENGESIEGGLIFVMGELAMDGGAMHGGSAHSGGAVAIQGGASFVNVEISDNTAYEGGAISVMNPTSGGVVSVSDTQFYANRATGFGGGAISTAYGSGKLTIQRTSFIDNRADDLMEGRGGALHVGQLSKVEIVDSIVNGNVTTGPKGGAGVYVEGQSSLDVTNTEFDENQVLSLDPRASGGAIFVGGNASVQRSNFRRNLAWVGGAVSVASGGALGLANSTVAANVADPSGYYARPDAGSGAAIYADSATIFLTNATIKDNEGISQLSATNASKISFLNTIAWTKQGVLNCDGQGAMIEHTSSLQNVDSAGASCSLPTLAGAAATVFDPGSAFNSPVGPPIAPVEHTIWKPKSGGPLSKTGTAGICLGANVAGVDERGVSRAGTCDIGAIEGL